MNELTDRATEIVDVCRFFGEMTTTNPNAKTGQVLMNNLGSDQDTVYLVLRQASRQFRSFKESLEGLEIRPVGEEVHQLALQSLKTFLGFTNPGALDTPWVKHLERVSDPAKWAPILAYSVTYRGDAPIKKLTLEQIEDLREKLSDPDIIKCIMQADAPEFLKESMRELVGSLKAMLSYVPVFGMNNLVSLSEELSLKNKMIAHVDPSYKKSSPYKKVVSIVTVLASLYVFPAEMIEATKTYVDTWQALIEKGDSEAVNSDSKLDD